MFYHFFNDFLLIFFCSTVIRFFKRLKKHVQETNAIQHQIVETFARCCSVVSIAHFAPYQILCSKYSYVLRMFSRHPRRVTPNEAKRDIHKKMHEQNSAFGLIQYKMLNIIIRTTKYETYGTSNNRESRNNYAALENYSKSITQTQRQSKIQTTKIVFQLKSWFVRVQIRMILLRTSLGPGCRNCPEYLQERAKVIRMQVVPLLGKRYSDRMTFALFIHSG